MHGQIIQMMISIFLHQGTYAFEATCVFVGVCKNYPLVLQYICDGNMWCSGVENHHIQEQIRSTESPLRVLQGFHSNWWVSQKEFPQIIQGLSTVHCNDKNNILSQCAMSQSVSDFLVLYM